MFVCLFVFILNKKNSKIVSLFISIKLVIKPDEENYFREKTNFKILALNGQN